MSSSLLFSLFGALMLLSAEHNTKEQHTRMLTEKKWTLVQYGIDENENGAIDFFEDRMDDCNSDDTYVFHADGTGRYDDHLLSCGNGVTELSFHWEFSGDEMSIHLPASRASIKFIREDKLIISSPGIDPRGRAVIHLRILTHEN
jgi:hypothetical protein